MPVSGDAQLRELGRQLKAAGQVELRKELLRSIRVASVPLREDIRESARTVLPRRGGLNRWVAGAKVTSRTRLTGRSVGVQIVAKSGKHDLNDLDLTGEIRHPVFGHRSGKWVSQTVTAGFFTKSINEHGETVASAVEAAIERVTRQLEGGV